MSTQNLGKGGAVERLQDGIVVVELSQRCVQFDEEEIVDTWVANVMTNG